MSRSEGFTLLELLVAIVIFVLMMVPAYGWMSNLLSQTHHTEVQAEKLADLQIAYRVFQRDLEQMVSRNIRNEFGDDAEALIGGSGYEGVEFSRAGHPNPAGFLRSELQRIAYIPDDDQLIRRSWRVLDRAQDSAPDEQVLIKGLEKFSMRFLTEDNTWKNHWPAATTRPGGLAVSVLPRAVEVVVVLEDFGEINWLFRLPGTFVPSASRRGGRSSGNDSDDGNSANGSSASGNSSSDDTSEDSDDSGADPDDGHV